MKKIGCAICQAWCWFFAAFDAKAKGGLSMRKVVAVWAMILVHKNHNKYLNAQSDILDQNQAVSIGDFSLLTTLTLYDYIMIGIALGMILIPDLIKGLSIFFNRNTNDEQVKTNLTVTSEK